MLDRILVPLDGSDLADEILPFVAEVARPCRSEVMLVRVLDEFAVDDALLRGIDIFGQTEARLGESMARLRAAGVAPRFDIRQGDDTAGKILEAAHDFSPSLVALSTHGWSGADLWLRGSTAERLLRTSPFPVLLADARARRGRPPFSTILVPLDGGPLSEAAVPGAHQLAKLFGSELVLLHVLEEKPGAYPIAALSEKPGKAEAMLARVAAGLEGVRVRTVLARGSPAFAILRAVEQEKADLVAMATHGRSRLSRWAFGSVAEQVLHHVHRPLFVVRTADVPAALPVS